MSDPIKEVVKVQISLFPPGASMLLYNCSRTVEYEGPPSPVIAHVMKGCEKAYFMAKIWKDNGGEHRDMELLYEVSDPGW
jgi:hypothetical protein